MLVSASAVGYYGDRGEEILDDQSAPGNDFLAQVCRQWEAAAMRAQESAVRVFMPRFGVVLGSDGGALAQMLPPFQFGAGGPIASGRQWMPWIHLFDLVEIIVDRIDGPALHGTGDCGRTVPGNQPRIRANAWAGCCIGPAWFPFHPLWRCGPCLAKARRF